jgi:hypothetical protein
LGFKKKQLVEKINNPKMGIDKLIAVEKESPKKFSFGTIKKNKKNIETNAPSASKRNTWLCLLEILEKFMI